MLAATRTPTVVLLIFSSALLSAAAPVSALSGTYRADCAPYDGSAFRITLAAPQRRNLELAANVPLAEMAGRWTHSDASRPGTAMILLCRETPERVCSYPQAGHFTVSGKAGGTITGTYEARFENSPRMTGIFRARPARNAARMLCG